MKKLSVLMIAALIMAACSNEVLQNDENPAGAQGQVTVTAALPSDRPESRVTLTEDNVNPDEPIIKVAWETEESFSVIRGTENKTYSKTTAGNTFTGNAHTTAIGTYYAFYPANENATAINALPYDLSAQTGALDKTKTYMYANGGTDGTKYAFSHLTALVKFTLTLPAGTEESVVPTKVVISSDKLIPAGTVDLTVDPVTYTAGTDAGTSITVIPADGARALTFYVYVNPMTASESETNTFVISMDGSDGKFYSGTLETSKSIAANYLYTASVAMGLVQKGSLAMKNGSFKNMTADEIKALSTDEMTVLEKEVAGIVFWTIDETTTEGRTTPANLTDDKILQADFPNCTHGLIVALKNVFTEKMLWQSTCDFVYNYFQGENFNPTNKADYKSITTNTGKENPVNYVLGYQNTKVLKAYNAYCGQISGKSDNLVLPVNALTDFEKDSPAPRNSTGWYIPSPKELHMLCYKDVDNIRNEDGEEKIDTKTLVNGVIEAVGGEMFANGYYWSSAEYLDNELHAFSVSFRYASVGTATKSDGTRNVRAVCAF